MLALLALLLAPPAAALDLTLVFEGEGTQAATLHEVSAEAPPLAALTDAQGDDWLVAVDELEQDFAGAWIIAGGARLADVPDTALERRFKLRLLPGEPASVEVLDPDGQPRRLVVTAVEPTPAKVVDCELLVAPTVDELATALQGFVDEARPPVTGVGQFTIDGELVQAQYVCGW